MSERKTISINPELFSLSGNTTRKKRPSSENKDLKIKSAPKQPHSTKTLRNRLLHYIRKNQEENFKKLHGAKPEITIPEKKYTSTVVDKFNGDFEESLKYMTEIADQVANTVDNNYMINQTLKNYKSLNPESILSGGDGDFEKAVNGLSPDFPPVFTDELQITNPMESVKINQVKQPQWGCMKGGNLPTYRNWMNQTHRVREPIINAPINLNNMSMSSIANISGGQISDQQPMPFRAEPVRTPPNEINKPVFDYAKLSQMKQIKDKLQASNDVIAKNQIKYGKRKKTIRRTYKLGKSRITPKVSVLISNKTVRKNISSKTEKLRQIPIDEIRAVLMKKGFIKVGSQATNDVLRKMYESMLLVCGEVENHNPDNLLYNYFNA
jgi:hypothetical protein